MTKEEIHIVVQGVWIGKEDKSNIVIWQTYIVGGAIGDNPDYRLGGTFRRGGERYFVWIKGGLDFEPDGTSMQLLVKNEWERRHEFRVWVTTK